MVSKTRKVLYVNPFPVYQTSVFFINKNKTKHEIALFPLGVILMRPAPIYYLRVKENMSVAMRFKSEGFVVIYNILLKAKCFSILWKGFIRITQYTKSDLLFNIDTASALPACHILHPCNFDQRKSLPHLLLNTIVIMFARHFH